MLLDRSLPRPIGVNAAGEWWDAQIDRINRGEVLPEAVWWCESEPAAAASDDASRAAFDQAVAAIGGDPKSLPGDGKKRERAAMGAIMTGLRGKVPGRLVRQWVKEAQL